MRYALAALPLATLALPLQAAELLDPEPRIAVMSAFAPEWQVLCGALEDPQDHMLHGMTFVTGSLSGQEVVVMLSGVSMVNAAMTTQMVLDHFDIEALVFSGIAGGVDPELSTSWKSNNRPSAWRAEDHRRGTPAIERRAGVGTQL